MASKEIVVPDLGDFKDVAVIDVLVQAGRSRAGRHPLLTLETEKATMDVPSPAPASSRNCTSQGREVSPELIATLQVGRRSTAGAAGAPRRRRLRPAAAPPAAALSRCAQC